MKNHNSFLSLIALLFLFSCGGDEPELTPLKGGQIPEDAELGSFTEVKDQDGNTYKIGFDQVSGNNQNPYLIKKDKEGNQIWKKIYENTPVDGKGVLITIDNNGFPWAVFTVDGGSNDKGFINKKNVEDEAFSNVFQNNYGSGGGPKASIITQIDPNTGNIKKGTFVTTRLTSGKTNSLSIKKIGFNAGNVAFEISAAAWPPGKGKKYVRFPDITDEDRIDNAFKIYYEMKPDLSEIVESQLLNN